MSFLKNDEIDSLAAIFCRLGEFVYDGNAGRFTLQFTVGKNALPVEMQCCIPDEYPTCIPVVYIAKMDVTKAFLSELNSSMREYLEANSFVGEAMLYEIIQWTKSYVESKMPVNFIIDKSDQHNDNVLCLIHLDHMRSKSRYISFLKTWSNDLNLSLYLLSYKQYIFVIIIGLKTHKSEFMKRWKLQNVDIDSKGHPCKERKMKVLTEQSLPSEQLCGKTFIEEEFLTVADFKRFVSNINDHLFDMYVVDVIR